MLVVNMAQHRIALSILVIVAAQSTLGQVMMVPPLVTGMRAHHNQGPHLRVVQPLYQPAAIMPRTAYRISENPSQIEPKEPIDEQRLHARIKELEILKQNIAQKQIELDEKIAVLEEQAMGCHKQIDEDQEVLRKLEELERLHSAEQMRLERLIEHQRLVEYRERIDQERLNRQRAAVEEWNNAQKERQKEETAEVARVEEPVTNSSNDKHNFDEATSSKYVTQRSGESNSEVQIQRPMSRYQETHKHDHLHSSLVQVHRSPKNPEITTGESKNNEGIQVMNRAGVMGPVLKIQESTNNNRTSQQQFERKAVGYEVANKK